MKFLFLSGHAHLALDPLSKSASGGAELQVALLSRALVKRDHQVTLLAANTGQQDGVKWEGVCVRTGGRYDTGKLVDTVFALPRIIKVFFEEKPDVVVVYGWTSLLYFLAKLRLAIRYKLVFVCALDSEIDGGFFRENWVRGYFFEKALHEVDIRFGITEHQATLFRKQGMPCYVTRLLLQEHASSETDAHSEKPVDLLWVARCHPVKQPHLFLDLAKEFPNKRCQMICSSQDKELWKIIRARAASLPNVEFLESIPYRDIQHYFNKAKIFVNTSLDEGVPNTFIHAGLGKTAIASLRVDPDQMFHQFHAGVCAGNDFKKFAAAIGDFLSGEKELLAAQEEASRFVQTWHDNPKNVDVFLEKME